MTKDMPCAFSSMLLMAENRKYVKYAKVTPSNTFACVSSPSLCAGRPVLECLSFAVTDVFGGKDS